MPKKPKINKSAWIRDQPADMSAAEIVAKAKAAKITVTTGQVYTARSAGKTLKNGGGASAKPTKAKPAKASGGLEPELRRLLDVHGALAVRAVLDVITRE